MSTSLFLLSMTKPQRGGHSHAQPPAAHSHQSTGWLSGYSHPTRSSLSGTVAYPTSSGEGYGPGSSRMPGHAPAGPTSHGHPLPCTGPPARFPKQLPLPVRSNERQVTDSHQLGDSLWESQYPSLPVCSIERQVTASQTLPAYPLPARSQERQVPVSRQPGGSLKEPTPYSLPVRSQERQVTVGQHTGGTSVHSSYSALPPMATQPPPLVSRTAQVGFPRTHSCNIGAPTPVAPSSNSIVRPRAHTQEDYSSNLGTVNSDYQFSTIPLKRALDKFSSPRRFYYERAPMDMLREWQRLGPDNIEVQPFHKLTTGSSTSYCLIDERCKQLTLILRAMDHFTQTISGSDLIRATFKADPERIVYSTLITSGWTELSTLHRIWSYLQRKLADFVLHFEHAKEVLALTQSRAASSRFITTDPSLAPVRPRTPEVIAIPPAAEKLELPSLHPSSAPDGTVAACTSSTERCNSSIPQSRQMTIPAQHSFELAHPLVQFRPSVAGSLCAGHLTGSTCRKAESMSLAAQLARLAADRSTSSTGTISPSRYASHLSSATHLDGSTQLVVDPALPTIQMDRPSVPSQHSPEPSYIHELLRPDVSCLSNVTHLDGSRHRVAASLPPIEQSDQLAALCQGSLERACPLIQLRQVVAYAPSARRFASPICRKVELASLADQLDRPAVSSLRPKFPFRHCPVADRPISVMESIGPSHRQVEPLSLSVQSNLPIDASCTSSATNLASSTRYIAESRSPTIQMDRLSDLAQHPLVPRSSELACPISLTPSVAELTSQSGQLGSITGPSRCLPEPIHSHISSLTHHAAFKCPTVQLDHPATPSWHPHKLACSDEPSSSVSASTATYAVRLMCHMGEPIPLPIQLGSPTGPSRHPPERTRSDESLRSATACWADQLAASLQRSVVDHLSNTTHSFSSTLHKSESSSLPAASSRSFGPASSFGQHCSATSRSASTTDVSRPSSATHSTSSVHHSTELSSLLAQSGRLAGSSKLERPAVPMQCSSELACLNESNRSDAIQSLTKMHSASSVSTMAGLKSLSDQRGYVIGSSRCLSDLTHADHPLELAVSNEPGSPVSTGLSAVTHAIKLRHCPANQALLPVLPEPLVVPPHHPRDSERAMTCLVVKLTPPTTQSDPPAMSSHCLLEPSCSHVLVCPVAICRAVIPMRHALEPAQLIEQFRPVMAHSSRAMLTSNSSRCLVEPKLTGLPGRLVTSSWNPHESHGSDVTSPSSRTRYISPACRAVNSMLSLALCYAIKLAPSQAQLVPVNVVPHRTPESSISLADDPPSVRLLINPSLLPVLSGLPAAYLRRPHELGHWYDPHHPASAGSSMVTNYIGSTGQAIAYSARINVQALNKVLSREVNVRNPQRGGTRIMTLRWSDYVADAKDSHSPITSPIDGWIHELLSLPARLDPLVNPSHHPSIEPMSSPDQPVILSRSTHEPACLHVLCRLPAAYTPTTTCSIDLAHYATKLMSSQDQLDLPASPVRRPLKLACPSRPPGDPTLNKGPGHEIGTSNRPVTPLHPSFVIACWHVPHRLAVAHSPIITHPSGPMCQRTTQSVGTDAYRIYPGHHPTQVEGQSIILIRVPTLDKNPNCGTHAINSHLGGTQIMTLTRLCPASYVKSSHLSITSLIDGWDPFLQLDPLVDSSRRIIQLARLCVPDRSGAGELSSATYTVSLTSLVAGSTFLLAQMDCPVALSSGSLKPECSCPPHRTVVFGRSIKAGSPSVPTHSFLESAPMRSSLHSVATRSIVVTRLMSSHNWSDPPVVPACRLLGLARLHGLCCPSLVHLPDSVHSTGTMWQASESASPHVHSDPPAETGHHPPELARPYSLPVACTPLVMRPVSSAQHTVRSPLHDQSDPSVVPVCCPLESAGNLIRHTFEPTPSFDPSDTLTVPARHFSEQSHSQAWTQPEPELSRIGSLQAQLPRSCVGSPKWIYATASCLEMAGTTRAPSWHHPRERLYPPHMVYLTSKTWRWSSYAAHPAAKFCRLKICRAKPKVFLTAIQVLVQTVIMVSYLPGPTKDEPRKSFYAPLLVSGRPEPGDLRVARSCANARSRSFIWHYKIGNGSILIQVVPFPAGRLSTTLHCRASTSPGRETVALAHRGTQWHLLQVNCLFISASSIAPESTVASSDQLNPIVLLHPLGWSHHLIKRENSLHSLAHSDFRVSRCAVVPSRLAPEPTQSSRVLAHSPSVQSRRPSAGGEKSSPQGSITGLPENHFLCQRTAPSETCIRQAFSDALSWHPLKAKEERFSSGLEY
ncbi:uncharacterized protein EI90DRAFT_3131552 [Cantharellus anzutake]|uniref:uncharacterized protein n=1 Tax=Cantharellus anzutake TaxID=1750568 RepID=UPI0019054086|nr:uncharacterized protein EI90DRAFT_3131552 [Cantharellus anzutake]KAF8321472.1 hypothetical protein EI90DRAFT_3131552 [Cantharellus anzutake]